jgi:cytohesin
MKHLLLTTIAAVVLVGCGESQSPEPPDIPIHQAVAQRNIEAVKQHLDAGTDVNSRAGLNQTPLDYTEKISLKTAKKEIADLLRKCGGKHSSIYEAAKGGDLEGIKEFLAAGVDPDEKTGITFDLTPLSIASTKEVAELLIDKGADVNAIPKSGLFGTSLDYAIRNKHPEIANLLRKHGGKTKKELKVAESIHDASQYGNIEAVKQHLAAGVDVNAKTKTYGRTPLRWAAWGGHKEIVELLIAEGADVNAPQNGGWTPLHCAAGKDHKEIAELLITAGADVNAKDEDGDTPLDNAKHKPETADLLRKHGGKYGTILGAAYGGDIEAVKEFLAAGANVNVKNNIGMTPLHEAVHYGRKEIAELLIAGGADLNAKDKHGKTPLHHAATKEIAELLIAEGADVNAKDNGGNTPLDWAIRRKHPETADLLRKHGGKTADWFNADKSIHTAARAGHIEAVKQHLAAGAEVNAKDDYGNTPLDRAIQFKKPETADLLRKHGGKTRKELEAAELGVSVEVLPDISIHQAAGSTGRTSNIEAIKQYLAIGKDVDARDKQDKTPLQHAAYWGHKEIVELLIAKGADINAKDNAGTTTLDWGRRGKNQTEIANLLRKHGGKTGEELKAEGK